MDRNIHLYSGSQSSSKKTARCGKTAAVKEESPRAFAARAKE